MEKLVGMMAVAGLAAHVPADRYAILQTIVVRPPAMAKHAARTAAGIWMPVVRAVLNRVVLPLENAPV